ncbi:hypothetical protein BJV78DRAFT_1218573 [Lactifluus subvellereus]|nr:hypothetical protein BJV78DRAFT_1218573 [Lactifluus subvellereus]
MGGFGPNHRPSSTMNQTNRESTPIPSGFPSEGRGLPSSARAPTPSDSSEQQEQGQEPQQQQQREHYRGITFGDILPAHLIMNAPPPTVDRQKRGSVRFPKPTERPPTPSVTEKPPPINRSYPSAKRSGGKSLLRNTARALVRVITVAKKDTPKDTRRRSEYGVV